MKTNIGELQLQYLDCESFFASFETKSKIRDYKSCSFSLT